MSGLHNTQKQQEMGNNRLTTDFPGGEKKECISLGCKDLEEYVSEIDAWNTDNLSYLSLKIWGQHLRHHHECIHGLFIFMFSLNHFSGLLCGNNVMNSCSTLSALKAIGGHWQDLGYQCSGVSGADTSFPTEISIVVQGRIL